jgi:hypothetical protein
MEWGAVSCWNLPVNLRCFLTRGEARSFTGVSRPSLAFWSAPVSWRFSNASRGSKVGCYLPNAVPGDYWKKTFLRLVAPFRG